MTLLTCLQVAASRVASAVCLPAAVASRAAALARRALTSVQRPGHLAGVPAAVGAALLLARALAVHGAALHAGGGEAAGSLGGRAVPLPHGQDVLEEFTAGQAFVVLLGEQRLRERERTGNPPPLKTSQREDKGLLWSKFP